MDNPDGKLQKYMYFIDHYKYKIHKLYILNHSYLHFNGKLHITWNQRIMKRNFLHSTSRPKLTILLPSENAGAALTFAHKSLSLWHLQESRKSKMTAECMQQQDKIVNTHNDM